METMVPGFPQGAPSLKRIRTVVKKDRDTSTFENKAGLAEVREKDMNYSTAVSDI